MCEFQESCQPELQFWLRDQFNAAYKASHLEGAVSRWRCRIRNFRNPKLRPGSSGV